MATVPLITSFVTARSDPDENDLDSTYGEIQRNGRSNPSGILSSSVEVDDVTGGLAASSSYQDEGLSSITSYLPTDSTLSVHESNTISVSAIPNPLSGYLSLFYSRRVETRRIQIAKTLREVVHIAQELLHEVELQEPRFISTLKLVHPKATQSGMKEDLNQTSSHGLAYYDGLRVLSPTRFEVTLFLNQMGVFNFVDDGSVPGGAVLKLSDGRKRSMSLWVEFITASGYLSARKIRARFHTLVGQALQKCTYRSMLRMLGHTSEVRICIRERYILQITPAFRCSGLWPRSASHWPPSSPINSGLNALPTTQWPSPHLVNEVKREGFCMLSQESVYTKDKQASAEGDAWLLDFYDAEERLLASGSRKQCLNILKTLADQHLTGMAGTPIQGHQSGDSAFLGMSDRTLQEYDLKTLVLHECEKHPRESEWTVDALPDRINGVLLQLISCLQHRYCPHYFLPHLDIFRGHSHTGMDITARQAWCLLRELLTCPRALERL
ncbi:Protein mab-21 1 [Fasciola gigantica]|uniref:Protein mab-21 1 n=1 Tax=Fasciola gigantica TaxID=46835 RepID=A0A504YDT3_FASGI|nr:Protein mab-21 1 [Fasciola gigantica]